MNVSGRLTSREVQVLELVTAGQSNKEVAESLCVTENTVKLHLRNIYGEAALQQSSAGSGLCREVRTDTYAITAHLV